MDILQAEEVKDAIKLTCLICKQSLLFVGAVGEVRSVAPGDKTNKGILVNFIEVSLLKVLSLIIDLPFELSILE